MKTIFSLGSRELEQYPLLVYTTLMDVSCWEGLARPDRQLSDFRPHS